MECGFRLIPALFIVVLWLSLSACGSSPAARFYTLAPLEAETVSLPKETPERRGLLAIGPIEIAEHLDRPQIVRRTGPTVVTPLEYHRWGGSLRSDVARVLVDNLTLLLAPEGLAVDSWEDASRPDLRLGVSVNQLESMDGNVLLKVLWRLYGGEGGALLDSGKIELAEPSNDSEVEAQVEAMSRALGELSRHLARKVAVVR
ncbi:MAG: PqiC family protein [Syntrophotaleaceae bacterium]